LSYDAAQTLRDQTDRLVEVGYPTIAGLDEEAFRAIIDPLHKSLDEIDQRWLEADGPGTSPLVLVVTRDLVRPEETVPLLRLAGGSRTGRVDRNHAAGDLAGYHPLADLGVPDARAYLLVGVERGEEFCGVRPEEALPVIRGRGRTPLTIDEGIAVVTHAPQLLEKNKCFMLSGSRRHDRRVPAMWISERAPKLGWCWDGNPHTWLGVASAAARVA